LKTITIFAQDKAVNVRATRRTNPMPKEEKQLNLWQKFREFMGWHKPTDERIVAGINLKSTCQYCGKSIMRDSQGGWFL